MPTDLPTATAGISNGPNNTTFVPRLTQGAFAGGDSHAARSIRYSALAFRALSPDGTKK